MILPVDGLMVTSEVPESMLHTTFLLAGFAGETAALSAILLPAATLNCPACVPPFAVVMVMPVTACFTVMATVAFFLLLSLAIAVMVVVPTAIAVTLPDRSTVATAGLLLVQSTRPSNASLPS